ncbi:MAG: transposase [Candidatus Paceibacterota bacterium]
MSIRKVAFVPGEYYHIYNRGNSKQKIFHNEEDYIRFLDLLYVSNSSKKFNIFDIRKFSSVFEVERGTPLVHIGAYVIMPNHFHVLISQTKDGSISKFMQKLTTAYAMYYNQKYKRTGSLFEGKFKSQHVPNDKYLKYLFSYIHLNPIKLIQSKWKEKGIQNKKEAIEYLNKYSYSSYFDYKGIKRFHSLILTKDAFPEYFPTKNSFDKEIFEWISYGEQE